MNKRLAIPFLALLASGSSPAQDPAGDGFSRVPAFVKAHQGRILSSVPAEKPFTESKPEGSNSEAKPPKFIRVNLAGYNVRKTAEFSVNDMKNVDHKTTKGALYAVTRIQKMQSGTAVGIYDGGQERWIFVPNWRKNDFQFCESEACFADLAQVLKVLSDQDISLTQVGECGIALDSEGSLLSGSGQPTSTPRDPITVPPSRSPSELRELDARAKPTRQAPPAVAPQPPVRATASRSLYRAPVWERESRIGSRLTSQLLSSLDRHGQGLVNRRSLGDAADWCPNYGSLDAPQRREFWAHLVSAIARHESRFKPTATFDEQTYTNPRRGRVNPAKYSQGLMMLSYQSAAARPYKSFCRFDWSRDKGKDVSDPSLTIYDTQKQLDCAVGILNKWVSKDGYVGGRRDRGGARFWSTLRNTNSATREVKSIVRRFGPCKHPRGGR